MRPNQPIHRHCRALLFRFALTVFVCCIAGLTVRADNPPSSLVVTENYKTAIRNDPDFGGEAVPILTSTLTASIYGTIPVASFNKKAEWSITIGLFQTEYSGAFSNDVNFAAGDRNITLPFIDPDTKQPAGTLYMAWQNDHLFMRVTTSADLLGAYTFYTGSTAPIIDTADLTITVGKLTNTLTLYVSGQNTYRYDPRTGVDLNTGTVTARADYLAPSVIIQTPHNNVASLNSIVNVTGVATDNIGVGAVYWRWAAPGESPTSGAAHFLDWTAVDTLTLPSSGAPAKLAPWRTAVDMSDNQPGTNRLWVVSQDQTERYSAIQTRTLFYSVPSAFTLSASEGGRAIGGPGVFNNANLIIDRTYTVKAVSTNTNSIFLNWTDGDLNVVSIEPNYTFLMKDSLSLQANFGPNPFPGVQGNYIAIFSPTNGYNEIDSGMVCVKITSKGTYTGTAALESGTYTFGGQFGFYGNSDDPNSADTSFQIKAKGIRVISGSLHFPGTNSGDLQGALTGQFSIFDARLSRRVSTPFVASLCPTNTGAVQAGTYNFVLPSANGTTQVGPLGYGYGTILLRSNATALVSMTLADQTPAVVFNSALTTDGNLPLFAAPYNKKGIVIGWLTFGNEATSDLRGDNIQWFKRRNVSAFYKDGFHRTFQITGCRYIAPKAGTNIFGWTDGSASYADFSFSGSTDISYSSMLNRFTYPNGNADAVKLSVAQTTGVFTGSVATPPLAVRGIILPKANAAYGFFLDQNQSGFVMLKSQ
jgi:hypothetical protein